MAVDLVTELDGEIFVHRHVWKVVERQLEHAQKHQIGSRYDYLVAMVFSFHTLEGYLNFVGNRLASELWDDERNNKAIRSFTGKAAKVFELCGIPEPNRMVRPYKTIWDLQNLRDMIAHPKTISVSNKVYHTDEESAPNLDYNPFDELVSHDKALITVHDVQELIKIIHSAASTKTNDIWFGKDGLGGPLSHGRGSTTLARR